MDQKQATKTFNYFKLLKNIRNKYKKMIIMLDINVKNKNITFLFLEDFNEKVFLGVIISDNKKVEKFGYIMPDQYGKYDIQKIITNPEDINERKLVLNVCDYESYHKIIFRMNDIALNDTLSKIYNMIININSMIDNPELKPKIKVYKSFQLDNYFMLVLRHENEKDNCYLCFGNIANDANNTINYIFKLQYNRNLNEISIYDRNDNSENFYSFLSKFNPIKNFYHNYIFTKLDKEKIKEIISINNDIIIKKEEKIPILLAKFYLKQIEEMTKENARVSQENETIRQEKETIRQEKEIIQLEKDQLVTEVSKLNSEIDNLKKQIEELQITLTHCKASSIAYKELHDECKKLMQELAQQNDSKTLKISELNRRITSTNKQTYQLRIENLKLRRENLELKIQINAQSETKEFHFEPRGLEINKLNTEGINLGGGIPVIPRNLFQTASAFSAV